MRPWYHTPIYGGLISRIATVVLCAALLHSAACRSSTRKTGDVNMVDSLVDARTRSWPLLNAAALGDTTRLKALLDGGSGLQAKDHSGLTALHWAAISNQPDCISTLVSRGADPNMK